MRPHRGQFQPGHDKRGGGRGKHTKYHVRCPRCGGTPCLTKDSRMVAGTNVVRRKRMCTVCQYRWSTVELSDENLRSLLANTVARIHAVVDEAIDDASVRNLFHLVREGIDDTARAQGDERPVDPGTPPGRQ